MIVKQFVMAYKAEQDRLRALLPEGFTSLRPVLRINAEIRNNEGTFGKNDTFYMEYNTPVSGFGRRGWLNIANWSSNDTEIRAFQIDNTTIFNTPFLEISYEGTGISGGCPAEKDNEGCFFIRSDSNAFSQQTSKPQNVFIPAEKINGRREFCNCRFAWHFNKGDACGMSTESRSVPAFYSEQIKEYKKEALTAANAAKLPCLQLLGSYNIIFYR